MVGDVEGFKRPSLEAGTIPDSHHVLPYSHPPPRDSGENDVARVEKETLLGGSVKGSTAIVSRIDWVGHGGSRLSSQHLGG